jgi:hypothetical protein
MHGGSGRDWDQAWPLQSIRVDNTYTRRELQEGKDEMTSIGPVYNMVRGRRTRTLSLDSIASTPSARLITREEISRQRQGANKTNNQKKTSWSYDTGNDVLQTFVVTGSIRVSIIYLPQALRSRSKM